MGLFNAVSSWFKRETQDIRASVDRIEDQLDQDLTRKERELTATPEEKMAAIQQDTAADDALAAIQDKIDGVQAHAEANADLIDPESD